MKWFRLWIDILDDHKIAQLSPYEFQTFIFLLACCSEEDALSGTLSRTIVDLSKRLRRRLDGFKTCLETFQKIGLITINDGQYVTINKWNKRQFISDNTYERVKKYREQQAIRNVSKALHETELKRPQITDTDTDTDKTKKVYIKKASFREPTITEISEYCQERKNNVNPQAWYDHYLSNGWMVGKNKMKNWQAAVRKWEHSNYGGADHGKGTFGSTGAVTQKAGRARSDGEPYPVDHEFS